MAGSSAFARRRVLRCQQRSRTDRPTENSKFETHDSSSTEGGAKAIVNSSVGRLYAAPTEGDPTGRSLCHPCPTAAVNQTAAHDAILPH